MKLKATVLDGQAMHRALIRISHEIIENIGDCENLVIIGIKTRGVPLAKRLAQFIYESENIMPETGTLDITLYRDDLDSRTNEPIINETDIKTGIANKKVVLVDDVLYTGRTARAALNAIMTLGRPSAVRLAVLVDRGHRELPIRADFVGKNVPTSQNEIVSVKLSETDETDCAVIYEKE